MTQPPTSSAAGILLALQGGSASAVVTIDTDGRITLVNAAARRLFSLDETAVGQPYPRVLGASLADRLLRLVMRAARSTGAEEPKTIEATLRDGRRCRLRAGAGPLRDAAGAITGVFLVAEEETPPNARSEAEGRAQAALRRYLGNAITDQILERPSFVGVGGTRQTISVLHADVRGYTTVAEALAPEAVLELLLRYHGAAVAVLQEAGATLDRYIGDTVLALWNAPNPQAGHARLALRGALVLRTATQAVGKELEYGIGLHTGEAVVGNLGSDRYMNYTAVGDTVNVAARLQSAAPAGGIVCSAALLADAGPGIQARRLGELTVKGRRQPVEAYSVDGMD